jgi:hypothetical protein
MKKRIGPAAARAPLNTAMTLANSKWTLPTSPVASRKTATVKYIAAVQTTNSGHPIRCTANLLVTPISPRAKT